MKPRILLAWEGGAGRGHLVTLKTVAEALSDIAVFDAALCRMDHAGEIAASCDAVFQGTALPYDRSDRTARGVPRTATWGEFLGDLGFRDSNGLADRIDWWCRTIMARQSCMVVGDYAPVALLAARALGIPAVGIGVGYGLPPPELPEFPILIPEFSTRIWSEDDLVSSINRAIQPFGLAALERLPELYRYDAQLVRSLPLLDPYASHRREPVLPPVADVADVSGEDGREVFAYLSTTEQGNDALMGALATLPVPVRIFAPGLDAERSARLRDGGVILESGPVPVELIARRSRLLVNSAQHGILCLGIGCGLPQIAIPQHLEQLFHARKVAATGALDLVEFAAQHAPDLGRRILAAYRDEGRLAAARALAERERPRLRQDARKMIRERILPLLEPYRS